MTPARLLAHFNRITEAPDAVPRLRRFILDLAVRGKLVEQDPNDEPASDLLKRIQAEKARLIKVGEMRQPDLLPAVGESDAPFELPSNWEWTRIGEAFNYDAGKKREPKELVSDRWLLELEDIEKDTSVVLTRLTVAERDSRSTKSEFQVGDILYGKLRPYLNKVVVANEPGYSTTEIVAIRPFIPLCSAYCCLAFRRPDFVAYVNRVGQGTKMPRLRTQDALVAVFPLPPLAEQHRIVAKVDELMALCDRLEAAQAERERRRDRLAAASLHRLNNGADAAEFREHARFHLDHLARFTTRPDQIPALRQTILNLAVRGKVISFEDNGVTPQLVNDLKTERLSKCYSSSEQDKIKQEFQRLETEWQDTKHDQRYITTLCACHFITKGTTPAANKLLTQGDIPFLKVYNIVNNKLDFDYKPTFINQTVHSEELKRSIVRPGDVLMNIVGPPLGKVVMVTDQFPEWNINQALAFFRPLSMFDRRFIHLVLLAPITIQEVLKETRGTVGQDNLSLEQVRGLRIPLITLEQQHRIIAKVEELLALCDQLEAQLTNTQTERRRLLESVLHEALAPAAS